MTFGGVPVSGIKGGSDPALYTNPDYQFTLEQSKDDKVFKPYGITTDSDKN